MYAYATPENKSNTSIHIWLEMGKYINILLYCDALKQ